MTTNEGKFICGGSHFLSETVYFGICVILIISIVAIAFFVSKSSDWKDF